MTAVARRVIRARASRRLLVMQRLRATRHRRSVLLPLGVVPTKRAHSSRRRRICRILGADETTGGDEQQRATRHSDQTVAWRPYHRRRRRRRSRAAASAPVDTAARSSQTSRTQTLRSPGVACRRSSSSPSGRPSWLFERWQRCCECATLLRPLAIARRRRRPPSSPLNLQSPMHASGRRSSDLLSRVARFALTHTSSSSSVTRGAAR